MILLDRIMIAHTIFFYIFSLIAIVSAIMVATSKNTVHSVFFLILDFISISCLFIMIGAEFLGMIMLIVYVGAVAVLFLFVVMMLNVAQKNDEFFQTPTKTPLKESLVKKAEKITEKVQIKKVQQPRQHTQ